MQGSRSPAPDDEQLACRAQQGCVASFEELVRRYQVPVVQFLRRLGAGADAEDLFQETCVRAYRNLHRYRQRWRFATWMFTIARRVRINHARRRRPALDGEHLESVPAGTPGPLEIAVQEEDRDRLWAAAARILSEEEMTAVWLHYVEDRSARETAAVLGRSWMAVKSMLFRARRRLLALLRESEDV